MSKNDFVGRRNVLIATRNPVFDPWLGNIRQDLASLGIDSTVLYCSSEYFSHPKKQNKLSELRVLLRRNVNFFVIASAEGAPFLYSKDWNKPLANYLSKRRFAHALLKSKLFNSLNRLFIYLYRRLGSGISQELHDHLEAINPKPNAVVALPTNMPGSVEHQVISWAKANNIPSFIPVMTLDNLSSKGVLLDIPSAVLCWNDDQLRYLRNHHLIPKNKIYKVQSLFFEAWESAHSKTLTQKIISNKLYSFLYVCSSARIGGYRSSENDRNEETKTILKLISRLIDFLQNEKTTGVIKIREHPTFDLDPIIKVQRNERLTILVEKGNFPDFESENESLIEDLATSDYCFGMNTSALLQSALSSVKTFSTVTESNRNVTMNTIHLSQLLDNKIVHEWNLDRSTFSELEKSGLSYTASNAQAFVGTGLPTVANLINQMTNS